MASADSKQRHSTCCHYNGRFARSGDGTRSVPATSGRDGRADQFLMDRLDVLTGQRMQFFAIANEQSQIAKAIDSPRNSMRQLVNCLNCRWLEDGSLGARGGEAMLDVAARFFGR